MYCQNKRATAIVADTTEIEATTAIDETDLALALEHARAASLDRDAVTTKSDDASLQVEVDRAQDRVAAVAVDLAAAITNRQRETNAPLDLKRRVDRVRGHAIAKSPVEKSKRPKTRETTTTTTRARRLTRKVKRRTATVQ